MKKTKKNPHTLRWRLNVWSLPRYLLTKDFDQFFVLNIEYVWDYCIKRCVHAKINI